MISKGTTHLWNASTYRSDEEQRQHCRAQGIDPDQHCCLDMAWFISEPVEWPSQGHNPIMMWIACWDEYRINIPAGGNASVIIRYCPWYGAKLPESKRAFWHESLGAMGYVDPGNDDIPEEFNSDAWWNNQTR